MKEKIVNTIISSKLPTITVVGFLLWIGKDLIIDSKEQTLQSPGVIVGIILIWIASIIIAMIVPGFKDKERMEFVFEKQEKSIKSLSEALEKTNKTGILREKLAQANLKTDGFGKEVESGGKEYTVDDEDKTLAS